MLRGLQIAEENLYSKMLVLTTTYKNISTLLDILGESGNFIASSTLCISETRKIEGNDFLFSVLQRTHFDVECRSGKEECMGWQVLNRAGSSPEFLMRFESKDSSLRLLQFSISLLKNDHFSLHPLLNPIFTSQLKLIAFTKRRFDH